MNLPALDPQDTQDEPTQPCCQSKRDLADVAGQRDLAEERRDLYRTLLAELLVATQDYLFAGSPSTTQRERLIDALARARVFAGQPREAA